MLDFGLLGDVLMEQGRVAEAAEAYQKMIDLKPFYQSYTRAAHLRWLKGDLSGAIEMMHAAVKAASPRDRESVAWAYSRLAMYELQRGRLAEAERMADASLQYVPDYAAALLARGRIQLARSKNARGGRDADAGGAPQPSARIPVDARRCAPLARTGSTKPRRSSRQLVREGVSDDPRTLALYLSTRREDGAKAVDLARRELEQSQRHLHARRAGVGAGVGRAGATKRRRSWPGRSPKEPRTAACSFTRR